MKTLLACLVCLVVMPPAAGEDLEASVVEAVLAAELDSAAAVRVEGLAVDMGPAELILDSGTLYPAKPVAGRPYEAVFVGEARFVLEPVERVEREQLELFTGQTALDEPLDQVVFAVGNAEVMERLLERDKPESIEEDQIAVAAELFGRWVDGPQRKGFGVDAAMMKAAVGDAGHDNYFAAWCRSPELDEFIYVFDPLSAEQISLGQFVATELDDRTRHRIDRTIRRARRKGRMIQFEAENLGTWNTWVATSLTQDGEARPGVAEVEPQRYILDVTIERESMKLRGSARIDLVSGVDGLRATTLQLWSDLRVRAVRDGDGNELVWHRDRTDLNVFLEEPVASGGALVLEVDYDGQVITKIDRGVFALSSTSRWYPHAGELDHATYDVTLRWPARLDLLASGTLVEQGEEGGQKWMRRTLEIPTIAFTFEVGNFDVHTSTVGHVELTVAFARTGDVGRGAKEAIVEAIGDALLFYEEKFGPYPLDQLTVATVPRRFSQGYLGMLTLSHYLFWTPRGYYSRRGSDENVIETIAHEVSHQWWGHKVGWASYRDQWLSEALASYSAILFTAQQHEKELLYRARRGWRWNSLRRGAAEGRTVESLGPVVLGDRLNSSFSSRAYSAVVYDKGATIFNMLARGLGEEPFVGMLGALAKAVNHRVISTETFIKSIERMSGVGLSEFADQFVYGTGIPEVNYSYEFVDNGDGSWVIEGTARQTGAARYSYELTETESGTWDVVRSRVPREEVATYTLVVPFQIEVAGDETEADEDEPTALGLGGLISISGRESRFSIPIDREPQEFRLDRLHEVLAYFYHVDDRPKQLHRLEGLRLEGEQALEQFDRALRAPLLSEEERAEDLRSDREIEQAVKMFDARLHLDRAAVFLDLQQSERASDALEQAEAMLRGPDAQRYRRTRATLASRLEILAGEYEPAYRRLKRSMFLGLRADGYALLAVAAHETGHEELARKAYERADERGADVSILEDRLGS